MSEERLHISQIEDKTADNLSIYGLLDSDKYHYDIWIKARQLVGDGKGHWLYMYSTESNVCFQPPPIAPQKETTIKDVFLNLIADLLNGGEQPSDIITCLTEILTEMEEDADLYRHREPGEWFFVNEDEMEYLCHTGLGDGVNCPLCQQPGPVTPIKLDINGTILYILFVGTLDEWLSAAVLKNHYVGAWDA